jgi:putative peptidoglycan lipid II flippase
MLGASLRLGLAAAIATGLGLLARVQLLHWLPDMRVTTVLLRAMLLCALGIGTYVVLARLSGVRELAEIQEIVLGKIRLKRWFRYPAAHQGEEVPGG